jgi:antitoxin component of MazEF toxin-antitoxin module
MISCQLEQIGDRLALVLDPDVVQALNLRPGGTVRLEVAGDGVLRVAQVESESWTEDPHARGRAFLKRYTRTIAQFG